MAEAAILLLLATFCTLSLVFIYLSIILTGSRCHLEFWSNDVFAIILYICCKIWEKCVLPSRRYNQVSQNTRRRLLPSCFCKKWWFWPHFLLKGVILHLQTKFDKNPLIHGVEMGNWTLINYKLAAAAILNFCQMDRVVTWSKSRCNF